LNLELLKHPMAVVRQMTNSFEYSEANAALAGVLALL
jgi:hypothetical protein